MTGAGDIIHGIEAVIDVIHAINPKSSGIVTVRNHSTQLLWRVHEHNDHGRFATDRAESIPPGGQDSFGVVTAENSIGTGCEGRVGYNAGGMGQATWTVHWNLPFIGENTSDHELSGDEASKYAATEDEPTGGRNQARFNFSLVGGPPATPPGGGGTPPGGHTDPPEPEYEPPVQADEPTLRHGDNTGDGWVEYLQGLLNERGYGVLAVDGDFGAGTHHAVTAFQGDSALMVDGVVGNQTWAALRNEAARDPSTDGRAPHTYEEQGFEARWQTVDSAIYEEAADLLHLSAYNTGSEVIFGGSYHATGRFTSLDAEHNHYLEIMTPTGAAMPGDPFSFVLAGFKAIVGSGIVGIEAYMPDELGGDQVHTEVLVP